MVRIYKFKWVVSVHQLYRFQPKADKKHQICDRFFPCTEDKTLLPKLTRPNRNHKMTQPILEEMDNNGF